MCAPSALAHDGQDHKLTEKELFEFEKRTLGEEHARQHAAGRRLARTAAARHEGAAPLKSSGTVFSEPLDAHRLAQLESQAAEAANTAPEVGGRWSPPFRIPVMAINAALLPTGKVLWYAYPANPNPIAGGPNVPNRAEAWLWDPATGTTKKVDPPLWRDPKDGQLKPANIWCSGTSFLIDGRVLVAGGNLDYRYPGQANKEFKGLEKVYTFDPFSETWREQPDMEHGRWYPTQARLPDGRTVILSGLDESGRTDIYPTNKQIEIFTPSPESDLKGVGQIQLMNGERGDPGNPADGELYPHAFWMPSGKLLIAGPGENDFWYLRNPDVSQPLSTQWELLWPQQSRDNRLFDTAVLMPNAPGAAPSDRVMQIGGWSDTAIPHNTETTEIYDESEYVHNVSSWQPGPSLQVPRSHHNTVLLPDGSMVTVGGGTGKDIDGVAPHLEQWGALEPHKNVELWDPVTGWRLGAAQQEFRTYHSTALLLPDGRVVSAGDDFNGGYDRDTAEIYEPPYLFKGPRPVIAGAPKVGVLGQSLTVNTPNAANVDFASLVAPGATTHANDMNQRFLALDVTAGNGQVTMNLPGQNALPPGWYMLFLVSNQGVPSVAHWIRIGHAGTPAPGEIVIENRTQPDTGDSFAFSGAPFVDFRLGNGQERRATVLAGQYPISQAAAPGYTTNVDCDDRTLSPSAADPANRRAVVNVSPGEIVRCVFTNTRLTGTGASLTIRQRTTRPASATFRFAGSLGSFSLASGKGRTFDVGAGEYEVSQARRAGFELRSIDCSDSDSIGNVRRRTLRARVAAGEAVTCTFTSRDVGKPNPGRARLNRRAKALVGRAKDNAGVKSVSVGLARKVGRRCQWWSPRRRGFAGALTRCKRPKLIKARLKGKATSRTWTARLRALPRAGTYTVITVARDAAGNAARRSTKLRVR